MKLFGWQFEGWDEDYLGGSFKAGMKLFGCFEAGMKLFGWQFQGWDETSWVAVFRLG